MWKVSKGRRAWGRCLSTPLMKAGDRSIETAANGISRNRVMISISKSRVRPASSPDPPGSTGRMPPSGSACAACALLGSPCAGRSSNAGNAGWRCCAPVSAFDAGIEIHALDVPRVHNAPGRFKQRGAHACTSLHRTDGQTGDPTVAVVSETGCGSASHPAMGQRVSRDSASRVRCAGLRPPLTRKRGFPLSHSFLK